MSSNRLSCFLHTLTQTHSHAHVVVKIRETYNNTLPKCTEKLIQCQNDENTKYSARAQTHTRTQTHDKHTIGVLLYRYTYEMISNHL